MSSANSSRTSSPEPSTMASGTTYDLNEDDVDDLFKSPTGSVLSAKSKKDIEKICNEELSNILEDCFLCDEDADSSRGVKEYYKEGVLQNMLPKNKKTRRKYKKYQDHYLDYCNDITANPSGAVNSQFTLCNYFNDR